MSDITRKDVIAILQNMLAWMKAANSIVSKYDRIEALEYAIASLETDEAYQLEYEPTTKNDLTLIHTEGLDEGIRCAMCTNSMQSDRGCDGSCVVNNAMYKEVMDVIENHIVDTDKIIEPTTKNDLGVDCISRQAVLEQAYAYGNGLEPDGYCVNVEDIQALPSVTPIRPKGHWIKQNDDYYDW